jgi:hypothetical protein
MTSQNFTIAFHCSITDRPFVVCLVRESNATKFVISHIHKAEPVLSTKLIGSDTPANEISFDQLSWEGFHCPHCDPEGKAQNTIRFFHCGNCKTYVCGANSGKFKYRCRPSCGVSGRWGGSSIQKFTGGLSQIAAPIALPVFQAPAPAPAEKFLALPKPPGTNLITVK